MRDARRQGLTTSLDPNCELRTALRQTVLELLPHIDLLFLNEREACELAGKKRATDALEVLERRVRGVVIKRGSAGAIGALDAERASAKAAAIVALDTTGAGDSFAGGFVSAFLRGADLAACLRLGNTCGAASTRGLGGTATQPTLAEVERLFTRAARPGRRVTRTTPAGSSRALRRLPSRLG